VPLYRDNSDKIVVQKSYQIGLTDWALCELFAQASAGRSVLYVLPTDVIVYEFSPRRIDKLIDYSAYLRANYLVGRKDSDSKKQKTLFGTDCHVVGSNNSKNFFEKPCDVLIIDEMDLCVQSNLTFAYDRLGASTDTSGAAREIWRKIGNPSTPGFGINDEYMNSDKKEWLLKCPHCNEWQPLDWFANVIIDEGAGKSTLKDPAFAGFHTVATGGGRDACPVCRRCNKTLNRLATGEWVAEHPDRDVSGYHASKLFGDPRSGRVILDLFLKYLKAQYDPSDLQHFYNQILGVPFTAAGTQFTLDILGACAGDYLMPVSAENTVGGCDVGGVLHLHTSTLTNGIRTKQFVGTCTDWDDLHVKCAQYGIKRGVIDALPEKHAAEEFCRTHRGWYRCFYDLGKNSPDKIRVDHTSRVIHAQRTASLDESFAHWGMGAVVVPKNWRGLDDGDFVKQMCAATRTLVEKPNGDKEYVWDEGNKPDHHQHADNYERLAAMIHTTPEIIWG